MTNTIRPNSDVILREIRKRDNKVTPFDTVGSTGLMRFHGTVDEEWHQKLKGINGVRAWREMRDNDSVIGNAAYLIEALIRQTRWQTVPAEAGGDEAQRWADFVEECMNDMEHTFNEFLSEVCSTLWFGWSFFEKIYKRREGKEGRCQSGYDDGLIGWKSISIRAQETLDEWLFSEDGRLLGMWQQAAPNYERVFIPLEKGILFRTQIHKNNPEGRSLLRNAWRSWSFLKRLQEIEAVGIERDLVGLPVIHLPAAYMDANASMEKQQARREFATLLSQIRRNEHEGVLFPATEDEEGRPTGFKLELLSSGGSRQLDVSETIKRYQRDIAMTLMTQFSFLGMDQVGSFSLSSDQTSMFATALGYIMDNIEETFHRYAVRELMELNGVPAELHPRVQHGDIEKEDMQNFASMLTSLISGGVVTPDPKLEDFTRDKLGLPPREEDLTGYEEPTLAVRPYEADPWDWSPERPVAPPKEEASEPPPAPNQTEQPKP